MRDFRGFIVLTFVAFSWTALITEDKCAADGRIVVNVVTSYGKMVPARAWVESAGQRLFEPLMPSTATPYRQDRSFSCDGSFSMMVREGRVVVHVEKGKEFRPMDVELQVLPNQTIEKTVRMDRWIDMPQTGWYSADLHVHLGQDDPRVLKQLALADDVHLVPAFTYWLRGQGETWRDQWPDESYVDPIAVDEHHLITRNNIEIERIGGNAVAGGTVGATFLFNLSRPVTAAKNGEHFPTDTDLCRAARTHSPMSVFDSDKPSWAETVVQAALGMLDTVQLGHNHYGRSTTLTGGWGMIGPISAGESNAAAGDGLFHRTNSLYYRLLNCGFRLGVSGGSAIGVMPMPTGHQRVYAKIDGPLSAEKLWQAIKAGRTFATSGPMLTLTANGQEIGSTLDIASSQPNHLDLHTTVKSIDRLEAIQIVHNGHIVATRDLLPERSESVIDADLTWTTTPTRSGWVAARALYRAPDGLLRQAHTSPIFIVVDGKPIASAPDARYMLHWVDQLAEFAKTHAQWFPQVEHQQAVLATYEEARTRYQQIVADAQQNWGD